MSLSARKNVSKLIKETLCGPLYGKDEVLNVPPTDFYTTGILYPQETDKTKPLRNIDKGGATESGDQSDGEAAPLKKPSNRSKVNGVGDKSSSEEIDELILTTEFKPSAFGISVITDLECEFNLDLSAAKYDSLIKDDFEEEAKERRAKDKYIPNSFKKFSRQQISLNDYCIELTDKKIKLLDNKGEFLKEGNFKLEYSLHEDGNQKLIAKFVKRKINTSSEPSFIITISLINDTKLDNDNSYINNPEHLYFQPKIKVYTKNPLFKPFDNYLNLDAISDQEELNNKLLYRDYLSFGSGHGCAVNWKGPKNNSFRSTEIYSEIIPEYKVYGNDFEPKELINEAENKDCEILYMKRLAGSDYVGPSEEKTTRKQIINELHSFVDTYDSWIGKKEGELAPSINKLNTSDSNKDILKNRGKKNLTTCRHLVSRMKNGIDILANEDMIYQAFCDANKAMFMQRSMDYFIKNRKGTTDKIYPGDDDKSLPNFQKEYHYKKEDQYLAKWRPFQLAFFLSQIDGIKNPHSKDRETVDLLWFSTGGGKTEAYLGLIAFVIFFRRLRCKKTFGDPDKGSGVTAFMRYTLRLLNKQQFNRAAPLVSACELIRRANTKDYGNSEISLGIWVGSSLTPNKWGDRNKNYGFYKSISSLRQDPSNDVEYSLPIFECPCCGTRLVKDKVDGKEKGEWGITGEYERGDFYRDPPFYLYCTNSKCTFYIEESKRRDIEYVKKHKIPIYFVDEEIYKAKPTLLFATVDKFASINWNEDCYKLFNIELGADGFNMTYSPPELIIQDELHLINSSLGTLYGIYEIAIDELCKVSGTKPKIVAATATVRNAEKQCKLLYGRKNFLQFPPPGINIDDSFYSRKKKEDNNARKYLGFQASGFTNTVAQIRLVAMLMQRVPSLGYDNKILDKYYTLLVYFNTLRELGKFRTLIEDDIVAYKKFLSEEFKTVNIGFRENKIHELSSALNADEINQVLENLENAELPKRSNAQTDIFYELGFRTKEDLDFLKQTKSSWFDYKSKNGAEDIQFFGEFFKKFNNKEIFEKLQLPFNKEETLDAVEENKRRFEQEFYKCFNSPSDVCQVVSATNMISVGIDIPRLNIMQITGQPRSHSEYIQASSRVGRVKPGLVITTYNPAKNRDRSHYEKFTDYHQAFYKDVESTTVTPFSLPALEKSLPAVIFLLMKCFKYGTKNKAAWDSDAEKNYAEIQEKIQNRIKLIYQSIDSYDEQDLENSLGYTEEVFYKIQLKWKELDQNYKGELRFSEYSDYFPRFQEKKVYKSLYVQSGLDEKHKQALSDRPTCMTSLRNVESGSIIKIETQF